MEKKNIESEKERQESCIGKAILVSLLFAVWEYMIISYKLSFERHPLWLLWTAAHIIGLSVYPYKMREILGKKLWVTILSAAFVIFTFFLIPFFGYFPISTERMFLEW